LPPEPPPAPEPSAPETPPRGIVFDLDGTLIDSGRDIAAAVNAMRAERGLPPLAVAEVGKMVGEGARMLVRRALPAGTGGEAFKAAVASYHAHYGEVCLDTTRPYPGIAGMLAALAQSFPLAVLSNKGEAISRRILKQLGLDRYLREVVGGDTLPTRKPNPGGLYLLADRLGAPASRLLLVGDSWVDADTAQAAGCAFAMALWGGATGGEASRGVAAAQGGAGATRGWRLAHPGELPAALGLAENGENGESGESGEGGKHGEGGEHSGDVGDIGEGDRA
jgi:phosphoglycolate phosphatase